MHLSLLFPVPRMQTPSRVRGSLLVARSTLVLVVSRYYAADSPTMRLVPGFRDGENVRATNPSSSMRLQSV